MFSMFGRTGAPTKRGPHKRTGKFLQHSNIAISDNLNNFVALNSSSAYSTPFVLCAYNYVMRVFNKMSIITTLSLCVSRELNSVGRYSYVREAPHFF